jgi:hypothetical protein
METGFGCSPLMLTYFLPSRSMILELQLGPLREFRSVLGGEAGGGGGMSPSFFF